MWESDKKVWVSNRKTSWKKVKNKIAELIFIKSDPHLKMLENYYLTGADGPTSLSKVPAGFLFEFWLHPNHSIEVLKELESKYIESGYESVIKTSIAYFEKYACSSRYLDASKKNWSIVTDLEPFFDGVEVLFYEYFIPKRILREEFKELSDEEYNRYCRQTFDSLSATFLELFYVDKRYLNTNNIIKFRVDYWSDALKQAYHLDKDFWGYFVRLVDEVAGNPKNYHKVQVEVANKILKVFDDETLPNEAKLDIAKSRAGEYSD